MSRSLEQSLAWVGEGTELCRKAIAGQVEASYGAPSLLAGWTRKHLVAHLAANAQAIGRLVSWARTGEKNQMYSSPEQRNADIEAGARAARRYPADAGHLRLLLRGLDLWPNGADPDQEPEPYQTIPLDSVEA